MVEYLALPAWDTPPRTIDEWISALAEAGGSASLHRESSTVWWLRSPDLDSEGYAVIESGYPTAINFELKADDPTHALTIITAAAISLGWEIHADGEDLDNDDEIDTITHNDDVD